MNFGKKRALIKRKMSPGPDTEMWSEERVEAGSPCGEVSDVKETVKRKSRNLSEKKRRDQFNMLVTELCAMVSNSRKMDKTTVIKTAIQVIQTSKEMADDLKSHEIDENWKPSFMSNNEFVHLMLEAIDGFVLSITATGRILYVSESVTALLGHLPERLMGKSLMDLVHTSDKSRVYHVITNPPMSSQHGSDVTHAQLSAEPIKMYFHMKCGSVSRKDSPQYQLVQLQGTYTDCDPESVGASEQCDTCLCCTVRLKQSQIIRQLPSMDDARGEFTSRHSLEWKFLFLDHRGPPVIGYLPFEVLGTSGYDYVHPDDLQKLANNHEQLMQSGEGRSCYYRFMTKGQQWIWLQSRYYITYHQWNSKPEFVVCTNTVVSYADVEAQLQKECSDVTARAEASSSTSMASRREGAESPSSGNSREPTSTTWPSDASTTWPTDASATWPSDASTTWPTDASTLTNASGTWPTDASTLTNASGTWPTDASTLTNASGTWPTDASTLTNASGTWPTDASSPWPTDATTPTNECTTWPTDASSTWPTGTSTTWPTDGSSTWRTDASRTDASTPTNTEQIFVKCKSVEQEQQSPSTSGIGECTSGRGECTSTRSECTSALKTQPRDLDDSAVNVREFEALRNKIMAKRGAAAGRIAAGRIAAGRFAAGRSALKSAAGRNVIKSAKRLQMQKETVSRECESFEQSVVSSQKQCTVARQQPIVADQQPTVAMEQAHDDSRLVVSPHPQFPGQRTIVVNQESNSATQQLHVSTQQSHVSSQLSPSVPRNSSPQSQILSHKLHVAKDLSVCRQQLPSSAVSVQQDIVTQSIPVKAEASSPQLSNQVGSSVYSVDAPSVSAHSQSADLPLPYSLPQPGLPLPRLPQPSLPLPGLPQTGLPQCSTLDLMLTQQQQAHVTSVQQQFQLQLLEKHRQLQTALIKQQQELQELQLLLTSSQFPLTPAGAASQFQLTPAGAASQFPLTPAGAASQFQLTPAGAASQFPLTPAGAASQFPLTPGGAALQHPLGFSSMLMPGLDTDNALCGFLGNMALPSNTPAHLLLQPPTSQSLLTSQAFQQPSAVPPQLSFNLPSMSQQLSTSHLPSMSQQAFMGQQASMSQHPFMSQHPSTSHSPSISQQASMSQQPSSRQSASMSQHPFLSPAAMLPLSALDAMDVQASPMSLMLAHDPLIADTRHDALLADADDAFSGGESLAQLPFDAAHSPESTSDLFGSQS